MVVLKDIYPKKLLDKKLYLASGVAAAFECKITLKPGHIEEAVETGAGIKLLFPPRAGTPYRELHTPILFGLLAHSHSWKSPRFTTEGERNRKTAAGRPVACFSPERRHGPTVRRRSWHMVLDQVGFYAAGPREWLTSARLLRA